MPDPSTGDLIACFRREFERDPAAAFKEWYVLQDGCKGGGSDERARALADDLWVIVPSLTFPAGEERARFFHNLAVFFGSPGPAASLPRALEAFGIALAVWDAANHPDDHARALHNRGNALQNLGASLAEAEEALEMYTRALAGRPETTRAIARGVTLHHMGTLARRMAALDKARAREHLALSREALEQAVEIRRRESLKEGAALSLFHLGLTHEAAGDGAEAARTLTESASAYEELGRSGEADVARRTAARQVPS